MPVVPSPLRLPLFRALWLGSIVSNIGTTMNDTAAVWTMTTLTGSVTMVSLMQAMSSLPLFLFALPAGALADLVNRRRLILFAQAGALFTAFGMAALAWHGMLNQSLLLLATFQLGLAAAFTAPAWQALIPEIVERQQLAPAIALSGAGVCGQRAVVHRGDCGDEHRHLHRHAAQHPARANVGRDGRRDPLCAPRLGDAIGVGARRWVC